MIYALLLNCSSFFSQRMAPWRPNFPHQRLLVCPVSSKESKNEQGPQGTCVLSKSDTKARVEARGWVGSIEDRPAKARASRGKLHSKRQTRRTTVVPKRKNPPKIDSHKVSSRVFQVSANSKNFRFRLLHELHIQNLSNHCRHKYDPSFHEFFESHFWRGFAIWPICAHSCAWREEFRTKRTYCRHWSGMLDTVHQIQPRPIHTKAGVLVIQYTANIYNQITMEL